MHYLWNLFYRFKHKYWPQTYMGGRDRGQTGAVAGPHEMDQPVSPQYNAPGITQQPCEHFLWWRPSSVEGTCTSSIYEHESLWSMFMYDSPVNVRELNSIHVPLLPFFFPRMGYTVLVMKCAAFGAVNIVGAEHSRYPTALLLYIV